MTNMPDPTNRIARVLQAEAARNGHALPGDLARIMAEGGMTSLPQPGQVQPVQVDSVQMAMQVAQRMAVGANVQVEIAPGIVANGPMPDWSEAAAAVTGKFNESHPEGAAWTEDETAVVAIMRLLADAQTREAAIRKAWNERHAPASDEGPAPLAFPQPPADRAPEGVDDGFGRDANGSEVQP